MVDTKTPGDKTLSVPTKTLTLKPRVETGTVRQSFSHGRTKQVVVEKRGKRRVGGDAPAAESHAPEPVVAKRHERLVHARTVNSSEIAVCADNPDAQYGSRGRIGVDQSYNTIALGLDQLDYDLRMTAGANNDNRLNARITCWVSHFDPCFRSHSDRSAGQGAWHAFDRR